MGAILALFASLAVAQQAPRGLGSAEGRVVNTATGEGLRKVTVRIYGSPGGRGGPQSAAETVSEADGSFRFENVAPGTYRVAAERAGFVLARDPRRSDPAITVTPGAAARITEIRMIPHAVITGKITDEDGDPMQGASVQLSRYLYVAGKKQLLPVNSGTSNDLGEYRIHSVPPGRYVLVVSMGGGFPGGGPPIGPRGPARVAGNQPDRSYVATYYPAGYDPAMATILELGPGQVFQGADVRMTKTTVYRIRGVVSGLVADSGRRGWPGAMVYLHPSSINRYVAADRRPTPVDTRTGSFELRGVRPGSYNLVVQQQGGQHNLTAHANVEVGEGDVEGVQMTARESADVKGRVVAEGNPPDLGKTQIQLSPLAGFASSAPSSKPGDDGGFVLEKVAPLRYRASVPVLPEGYFLKSVEWSGRIAEDAVVDFSAGAVGLLSVNLEPGAARIEGVVRNDRGDPLPGVKVTIAPDAKFASWWELYREVTSGTDGTFQISNLRPGDYRIYAWTSLEPGAHQDPDFLEPFDRQSSPVSLRAGGQAVVHPKPIEPGRR
jgi:hypothetical protein